MTQQFAAAAGTLQAVCSLLSFVPGVLAALPFSLLLA
jgi:hypothetical protein